MSITLQLASNANFLQQFSCVYEPIHIFAAEYAKQASIYWSQESKKVQILISATLLTIAIFTAVALLQCVAGVWAAIQRLISFEAQFRGEFGSSQRSRHPRAALQAERRYSRISSEKSAITRKAA